MGFGVIITSSPNGSPGWLGAPSAGDPGVEGVAACGQDGASPTSTSPAAARPMVAALRNENILRSLPALPARRARQGYPRCDPSSMAERACDVRNALYGRASAAALELSRGRNRLANRRALAI